VRGALREDTVGQLARANSQSLLFRGQLEVHTRS
jgi:hypothetical protein